MQRKQNPRHPKYHSFTVSRSSFVDLENLDAIDRPLLEQAACVHSRISHESPFFSAQKKSPLDLTHNRIAKRAVDITISAIMIIFFLSWLVPLLSVIIRFAGFGPLFIHQKRKKRNGGYFTCIRFAPLKGKAISVRTNGNMERKRSRLGQIIKKYHLESLPQFFNVLMGDMSIIGPVSYLENEALKYEMQLSGFSRRYAVKPGISGLDQFLRQPESTMILQHMKDKTRLDLYYINHWSAGLDCRIMLRTLRRMSGLALNYRPIYPWESV